MIKEFGPSSALFQAQYYNFDGYSGAGVVTTTVNNIVKVVLMFTSFMKAI
jgi:hypothetical protein